MLETQANNQSLSPRRFPGVRRKYWPGVCPRIELFGVVRQSARLSTNEAYAQRTPQQAGTHLVFFGLLHVFADTLAGEQ